MRGEKYGRGGIHALFIPSLAFHHFISPWLDGRGGWLEPEKRKEAWQKGGEGGGEDGCGYCEGIARDAEIRLHDVCSPCPL